MKKLFFILMATAAIALVPTTSMAQMENPRGIYKMTRLTGNLGEVKAPFEQYKICTDSVTLMVSKHNDVFFIGDNDHMVFNYTGDKPKLAGDTSSLIYDSNSKQFKLKWWSTYQDHIHFPHNGWCIEKYESGKYTETSKVFFEALAGNPKVDEKNPLVGTWRLIGFMDKPQQMLQQLNIINNQSLRNKTISFYVFTPKTLTMIMAGVGGRVDKIETDGKNKFKKGKTSYHVEWLSKDNIAIKELGGKNGVWTNLERVTDGTTPLSCIARLYVSEKAKLVPDDNSTNKFGTKQSQTDIPMSNSDSIYLETNVSHPRFEGGDNALMRYLQMHLHYPDPIYMKYGFEGRLLVTFVVEKDGSLQHIAVLRNGINTKETAYSLHVTEEEYETIINKRKAAFENYVINFLQSMPRWQPAIHETNGKKEYVRMKYTMPFTFRLQ